MARPWRGAGAQCSQPLVGSEYFIRLEDPEGLPRTT